MMLLLCSTAGRLGTGISDLFYLTVLALCLSSTLTISL